MAIYQDGKNLWMYKGDTGNIVFSGLPKDQSYTVYLSIFDADNDRILTEITATNYDQVNGTATFIINEDTSNLLKVGTFTYALKGCYGGSEDTWIPETKLENGAYIPQDAPSFEVKAKRVEGQ